MAQIALQEVLAEYGIKDLASKSVKKLQKEVDKSIKDFVKLEKQSKKTDGVLSRFGKRFKGVSARGLIGGAEKTVSGAGVGLGGLPVFGGLVAGTIAAINQTKNKFLSGLELKKQILEASTDFQVSFGKRSKEAIDAFDKSFITKTEIESTLSGLTSLGVLPDAITESAKLLEEFAKSQQKSLAEVFSGPISAGRGLTNIQIKQIEVYRGLLSDVTTAQAGFEGIVSVLRQSEQEIKRSADTYFSSTREIQGYQTAVKNLTEEQALLSVQTREDRRTGFDAFRAALESEKLIQNMTATISSGASIIIEGAAETANFILGIPEPEKRAFGGEGKKGKPYIVGDAGKPELFVPDESGYIFPDLPSGESKKKESGPVSIKIDVTNNININESDNPEKMISFVQNNINEALDTVGRRLNYMFAMQGS